MAQARSLVWVLGIIALMSALIYMYGSWSRGVNRAVSVLVYPVVRVQHAFVDMVDNWDTLQTKVGQLQQRILVLEQERSRLLQNLIALNAVYRYDAATAPLREFVQRYAWPQARVAQVLLMHRGADEHYLLIDGGENVGINTHMIVLVDNHLIGRVVAVYPSYSKILLITDRRMNIAAYCAKTGSTGIFAGSNQVDRARLTFVDHMQPLVIGDMVLTSGQGLVYPQGLGLGTIVEFTKRGVEYDVVVAPLIDVQHISYCLVVSQAHELG